jgi:hypothetical protein
MPNQLPRYRTDFKQLPVSLNAYTDGVLQDSYPFNRWLYYHWMSDQINPINRATGKRPPGFCQHLKLDKTYIAKEFSSWRVSTGHISKNENPDFLSSFSSHLEGNTPTGDPTDVLDIPYQNVLGVDFFQTPRFSDLCFEAWTKLKTQVPDDVSLLNFAFEALDYKDLAKRVLNPKKSLRDLRKYAGTSNWSKVRRLPKQINGEFLDVSFNWLPLVSDTQKIFNLYDTSARKLDFLRKTRGKEVVIRFSKPDCYINNLVGVEQLLGFQNDDWKRPYKCNRYQCDFTVTAKLYQELEGLDDAWAGLRALIASAGINNPLKAVWNAIPFSFVVDWVAPFGQWLERAAVQPFYGVWKVYDITTSVRERGEVEVSVEPRPGRDYQFTKTLVTKVEIDKYTRLVGLPQTLSAFDFTQLNQQQQKLFLSLVLTKVL